MVLTQSDLIQTIETLLFRALPALEQRYYDGWVIRFADGYTGRANSINPIYGSDEDIYQKINHCEMLYIENHLPPMFKLTPIMQPADLESILEQKGYHLRDDVVTHVMTATLSDAPESSESSDNIEIQTRLKKEWLNTYIMMNKVNPRHHETLGHILKLITTPCGFALLRQEQSIVAVALGVVDGDWMGIFDVVVAPDYRRKGFARTLMNGLLAWGKSQGAKHAYLQVVSSNTPAVKLYESLGFTLVYEYWYRVKDL